MRSVVGARPLSIVVGLGLAVSVATVAPVAAQPLAPVQRAPVTASTSPYSSPVASPQASPAAPVAAPGAAPVSSAAPPRGMSPLRGPNGTASSVPGFNTLRGPGGLPASASPQLPASAAPPAAANPVGVYPPNGALPNGVMPNGAMPGGNSTSGAPPVGALPVGALPGGALPGGPALSPYPGSQRAAIASPYGEAGGVAPAVGPAPSGYLTRAAAPAETPGGRASNNQIRLGAANNDPRGSQLQIRPGPLDAPPEAALPGTPSRSFATQPTATAPPTSTTFLPPSTPALASPPRPTTPPPPGSVIISDDGSLSDVGSSGGAATPPAAASTNPLAASPPAPAGVPAASGLMPVANPSAAPAITVLDAATAGTELPSNNASPAGPATPSAVGGSSPIAGAGAPATPFAPPQAVAPPFGAGVAPMPLPAQLGPTTAAAAAAPAAGNMPKLEPVDFNGVLLGESTVDEVLEAWGEPRKRSAQDGVTRLSYLIEPFSDVEVTFFNGRATAVVIDLGETFPAEAVARELGLDGMPSVAIDDPRGRPLGLVFPERGVAFRFADDGTDRLVKQIGLDRIDPRPFVLRAERRLRTEDAAALADVDTALVLDAANGRAHFLRAQILRAAGRRREAMAAVEAALKAEPKSPEFLLVRGQLLADEGLFEAALEDTESAIQATAAAPHLQARGWSLRGDFLANGPQSDYVQAIDAHTRAIRLAEPLLSDERVAVRRAAREVLVEAHLGTAEDVAWGEWAQKETVVPKWLGRAEKLAADGVKTDALPVDCLLAVYRRALAASVGTQGKVDPKPWAEKLLRDANVALVECSDPMRRTRLQYETGFGLYDGLQAAHARGNVDEALRFGTAAVERIQPGRAGRDSSVIDGYRYGRLYFRVGSLYAVGRQDHATAVEWFERAAPLLERPLPEAAAADRGRQGETLVSMGISYWAVGKHERALELTTLGTRIMQGAVQAGTLEPEAMAVAYGNLSTMHDMAGDAESSRRYAEMASRLESAGGPLRR